MPDASLSERARSDAGRPDRHSLSLMASTVVGFAGMTHLGVISAVATAARGFSVGGGDAERNISVNLVRAIDLARERGAKVFGVVGRSTGYTARHGDVVVVIPPVDPERVTPLSEGMQGVVWHCLVSHPVLQTQRTKW